MRFVFGIMLVLTMLAGCRKKSPSHHDRYKAFRKVLLKQGDCKRVTRGAPGKDDPKALVFNLRQCKHSKDLDEKVATRMHQALMGQFDWFSQSNQKVVLQFVRKGIYNFHSWRGCSLLFEF